VAPYRGACQLSLREFINPNIIKMSKKNTVVPFASQSGSTPQAPKEQTEEDDSALTGENEGG